MNCKLCMVPATLISLLVIASVALFVFLKQHMKDEADKTLMPFIPFIVLLVLLLNAYLIVILA